PLAGITTTATLLAQADAPDRLAVAAIDSHLGDWFCALGEHDSSPFLAATEVLATRVGGRPCRVVGPQADVLAPLLADAVAQTALPDAPTIAGLAPHDGLPPWRHRNRV